MPRREIPFGDMTVFDDRVLHLSEVRSSEHHDGVLTALADLPELQLEIVYLLVYDFRSERSVADELGLSRARIRALFDEAKVKVAKALSESPDEPLPPHLEAVVSSKLPIARLEQILPPQTLSNRGEPLTLADRLLRSQV